MVLKLVAVWVNKMAWRPFGWSSWDVQLSAKGLLVYKMHVSAVGGSFSRLYFVATLY
jgi:hypothetical protein